MQIWTILSFEGKTLTFSSRGITRMPPTLSRFFMYSSWSFCTPAPQYTLSYWRLSGGISRQLPTTKDGSQNSNLKRDRSKGEQCTQEWNRTTLLTLLDTYLSKLSLDLMKESSFWLAYSITSACNSIPWFTPNGPGTVHTPQITRLNEPDFNHRELFVVSRGC